MRKPTPDEIRAAHGATVPDLIAPGLRVLFCGINPSLYSAAIGHHFARPGNRFWPALHAGGFTDRVLQPDEGAALLAAGCGITNLVDRATATAAEVEPFEFVAGAAALVAKVTRYRPGLSPFSACRPTGRASTGAARPSDGNRNASPGRASGSCQTRAA